MPLSDFYTWLATENQRQNIKFAGWAKDGTVIVYLNGTRHVYITDAVYHDRWKSLAKRQPELVMSQIAQLVRTGRAEQVEPPSKPRDPILSPQKAPQHAYKGPSPHLDGPQTPHNNPTAS